MKKPKISLWFIFLVFFVFLGFLEAGVYGAIAGFLVWAISNAVMPVALIPFFGFFIWKNMTDLIFYNLAKFFPTACIQEKMFWIYGVQAIIYTVITSIVTVAIIVFIFWLWLEEKDDKIKLLFKRKLGTKKFDFILDIINFERLEDLIVELKGKIGKLDNKVVGSALFWLGLGIASHDFHWETSEWEVDVERPTHGAYMGLSLATLGLDVIERSYFKKLWAYLGLGLCYLAFMLLSLIPKGTGRIMNHVLWWTGASLMTYNWYLLVEDEIWNKQEEVMALLK